MASKYERPEVKTITRQWVHDNCQYVTDRDMGLLRVLAQNKLMKREHIQKLYPMFPSTDRLDKRLTDLYRLHVIDRVYPPKGLNKGTNQQHVCLDRAGVILLDLKRYNKPIKDIDGIKTLPLGWRHMVSLTEYRCGIQEVCNEIRGKVLVYEVEQPHKFGQKTLKPDIFCLISIGGKGKLLFIEVDLGTEDVEYVKAKLDSYRDYYMSKAWVSLEWAKIFKTPIFPRVLLLTENNRPKREKTLHDHVKESMLKYHIGSHETFKSILGDILKG